MTQPSAQISEVLDQHAPQLANDFNEILAHLHSLSSQHQQNSELVTQVAHLQGQIQALQQMAAPPQATHQIPLPVHPSSSPSLPDPPVFNGKKSTECRSFLDHCRLNFRLAPSKFPTEEQKVFYAIRFLRDTAFDHYRPSIAAGSTPDFLLTFENFATDLLNHFGISDEKERATRDIWRLSQTGSAASYIADFDLLANVLDWGDEALSAQFYRGLKPTVKDELARIDKPSTFVDMKKLALRIDNRLFERDRERRQEGNSKYSTAQPHSARLPHISAHRTHSSSNHSTSSSSPNSSSRHSFTSSGPVPMDVDQVRYRKLTPEERQKRINNGECLYCGEKGHQAGACPNKANKFKKKETAQVSFSIEPADSPQGN
jgi:hypothetical protein